MGRVGRGAAGARVSPVREANDPDYDECPGCRVPIGDVLGDALFCAVDRMSDDVDRVSHDVTRFQR